MKYIVIFWVVLGASLAGNVLWAQDIMVFAKDSMLVDPNGFESNLLKIKQRESGTYTLKVEIPEGVEVISSIPESLDLKAGKLKPIVFRFRVNTNYSSERYQEVCFLLSKGGLSAKACFSLKSLPLNKIIAEVVRDQVKMYEEDEFAFSELRLRNDGNVPDSIFVLAEIRNPLQGQENHRVFLNPGEDTTISLELTLKGRVDQELPDIRYNIKSRDQSLLLVQDFFFVRNTYAPNDNRNLVLPLSVTSIGQVINGSSPVISTAISGNIPITDNSRLGYQWFGIGHFDGSQDLETNQWHMEYSMNRGYIRAGRLQYMGLVGQNDHGLEAQWRSGGSLYRFNAMRNLQTGQQQLGMFWQSGKGKWGRRLGFLNHNNPLTRSQDYQLSGSLDYSSGEDFTLQNTLRVGLVNNPYYQEPTLQYEGRMFKRWNGYVVNSSLLLTGKRHPSFNRGEKSLNLEAMKVIRSKSYGINISAAHIQSTYVNTEGVVNLPPLVRGVYQVFIRNRAQNNIMQVSLGAEHQVFRGLETWYFRPELRWNLDINGFGRINQTYNLGQVFFPATGKFAYRHEFRQQIYYGKSQAIIRWKEGPQDYFELLIFENSSSRTGLGQIRLQHSETLFPNTGRVTGFVEFNHQHISGFKRYTTGLSTSWKLWKTASIQVRDQWSFGGARPVHVAMFQLNMSLEAPIPFTVEHPELKVKLLMDQDGDGQASAGDEPVIGQFVAVDSHWLITDEMGRIKAINLDRGEHTLDLGQIKERGWQVIGANFKTFVVNEDMEMVILLKQTKVIEGSILVDRDKHSKWFFDLDYIRVEAISKTGEVYTALTNDDGFFSMNVPAGEYKVRFNSKVFSPRYFQVDIAEVKADLTSNDYERLEFKVSEKKRRIVLGN